MNWMHQQITRLLANRRLRLLWTLIIGVAVVCTVAGVSYAMVQGATALSGSLNAASAGVTANDASSSGSNEATPNPDKGKLTGATFFKDNGGSTSEVKDSDMPVEAGTRLQFALSFEFTKDDNLSNASEASHTITYTLPDGVTVGKDDARGGDIQGAPNSLQEGKKIGTYRISGNKLIMVFDNSEVPELYNQTVSTTVRFWATATNDSVTDEENIEFPGGRTLTVKPTTPELQVSKKAEKQQNKAGGDAALDDSGNQNDSGTHRPVNYTITVGSTTGTGHAVTIDDTMSKATNVKSVTYDKGSFSLKKYASSDDDTGETVAIGDKLTIDKQDDKDHFKIENLPALKKGERYELTYKATVNETDHSADTSQTNSVKASINDTNVSKSGSATAQWGNKGDIAMHKTAKLLDYTNPDNPNEKHIQYQLVVTTTDGTGTRIQIGDTATPGTNVDTSSWSKDISHAFYDRDSFKLRKYQGTYTNGQAIDPDGGTDESDKLGNIAIASDGGKPSLSLPISEPLNTGEYYVLTYTGIVYEKDHNAPDTTMNNAAVARIYPGGKEDKTRPANAPVTWHNEIEKNGNFNADTGYIDWSIQVNRNNGNAVGAVISDTLTQDLVSDIRVYRDNANGTGTESLVQTIDLLSGNHSVDTSGVAGQPSTYNPTTRELKVVLGDWANSPRHYTIKFSTKAPANGTVENTAAVVYNGKRYSSQGIRTGINRQTQWGIEKATGSNSGTLDTSTGIYTMAWNATATFPDQDLTPDASDGVLKLTDTFGDLTQEDGSSSSNYANLHYAVAKDLYKELTGNSDGTTVTLSLHNDADSNGEARTYTLKNGVFTWGSGDDAVTLGHVKLSLTFYDASNNVINDPANSEDHVKRFEMVLTTDDGSTINGRQLKVTNYHSLVNGGALPASTTVNAGNSLSSNRTNGTSTNSQSITTLSNPMEKQVRTLDNRGDNSDTGFAQRDRFEAGWNSSLAGQDYDDMSGKQHAAQYRIALNTVSYPDNATVTIKDTLPVGLKLVTSTNNGATPHPIRLVQGQNIGQSNASYSARDTLSGNSTRGTYLSYTTNTDEDGRQVVTFTFKLSSNLPKGQYYITYTASFLDDDAWDNLATTERTYTNTADATVAGKTYSDSSTLNVTRQVDPVQKSQNGTLTNDRKGKYKIIINPAASDLKSDSDTVELLDTLTNWNTGSNKGVMDPQLDLTSVHLYLYDSSQEDGIGTELDKTRYSMKYEQADGDNGYRRIRLTVPDSMPLVFVYDYTFNGTQSGDWGSKNGNNREATVGNTATLDGTSSSSVNETVKHADSDASGYTRSLALYKVDEDNHANMLSGSLFDLYEYNKSGHANEWFLIHGDIPGGQIESDGQYHPYVFSLATGQQMDHNVLYRLVETKAPEGYAKTQRYTVWLDQGQTADQAWRNITGSDDPNANAPAPLLDIDGNQEGASTVPRSEVVFLPYYGGNLYVTDKYQSVTVTKNWSGSDGTPLAADDADLPASVKLQLKRAVQGSDDWTNYGDEVTVTKNDDWKHTWGGLPQQDDNGHTYIYKVEEVGINEANGSDSTSRWKATYLNNDGVAAGNITITNVRQYTLPGTGGIPYTWIWIGGGLAAAVAAGVLVVRRLRG